MEMLRVDDGRHHSLQIPINSIFPSINPHFDYPFGHVISIQWVYIKCRILHLLVIRNIPQCSFYFCSRVVHPLWPQQHRAFICQPWFSTQRTCPLFKNLLFLYSWATTASNGFHFQLGESRGADADSGGDRGNHARG